MTYFFKWFLSSALVITLLLLSEHFFGLITYVVTNDVTFLSIGIFILFLLTSLWIGKKSKEIDNQRYMYEHQTKKAWWAADACMAIGMVGTLIGLLIVLTEGFADVDTSSVEAMRVVIGTLATGMGTALITSLVGLISSFFLKYQLVTLETANEDV